MLHIYKECQDHIQKQTALGCHNALEVTILKISAWFHTREI